MTISVTPRHFTGREQALSEIAASGLRFVESEIAPLELTGEPHKHPYLVDIYMLEGVFDLHEPGTGLTYRLEAGTRAVVPADTLHSESSPAPFRAAFGVSANPDAIMANRGS